MENRGGSSSKSIYSCVNAVQFSRLYCMQLDSFLASISLIDEIIYQIRFNSRRIDKYKIKLIRILKV